MPCSSLAILAVYAVDAGGGGGGFFSEGPLIGGAIGTSHQAAGSPARLDLLPR
jgi:hypothetical protein